MQKTDAVALQEGFLYHLKQPIGPIPAGIYRLEDADAHCWHFSVGSRRRIRFLIIFGCSNLLHRVSTKKGRERRTRESEFAEHYYRSLRDSAVRPDKPQSEGPISACMMPADIEAQYDGPFAQKAAEVCQRLN